MIAQSLYTGDVGPHYKERLSQAVHFSPFLL